MAEYKISEYGRSLLPIIDSMTDWAVVGFEKE
jgi:DNA-binding HxlR family transcriptional regulator